MAQAGPLTATTFHNMADSIGAMGGATLDDNPLQKPFAEYMKTHQQYVPADARYLSNHRGHLMYVRQDETHITSELVRRTTMSGTKDELVTRLRELVDAGYSQLTIQLVHNHESALEDWAEVFKAV